MSRKTDHTNTRENARTETMTHTHTQMLLSPNTRAQVIVRQNYQELFDGELEDSITGTRPEETDPKPFRTVQIVFERSPIGNDDLYTTPD